MTMQPGMSFIPYVTLTHKNIGNVITFAQFEEVNVTEDTKFDTNSDKTSQKNSFQ